ncbi:MAG: hypothetical protein ACRD2C_11615 [Acidimicrobiales bacterium]
MSGIDASGNTPVVGLERLVGEDCAEAWVMLETRIKYPQPGVHHPRVQGRLATQGPSA